MLECVFFWITAVTGLGFFSYNILKIKKNISYGRDVNRSDNKSKRLKTMLLVAFGQKKNVFKINSSDIASFYICCIYDHIS